MSLISYINECPAVETEVPKRHNLTTKNLQITVKLNYVLIYEPPFSSSFLSVLGCYHESLHFRKYDKELERGKKWLAQRWIKHCESSPH